MDFHLACCFAERSVSDLPLDERPREKLAKFGAAALDNAELLALFLRTGTKGRGAIQIGRDLLGHYGSIGALGSAGVTIVDARAATRRSGPAFGAEGMRLSIINAADSLDLASFEITPASFKKPTSLRTRPPEPATGGIAFAPRRLEALLHADLLRGSPEIDRPSFRGRDATNFRFSRLPASKGWEGLDPLDIDRITISTIGFAIIPITVALQETSQ